MHSSSGEPLRDSKSVDGGESTRPIDSAERARLGLDLPGRLGAFILGDFLGRGGMGSVYRARHAKTDAAAVLKLMPTIAPPAFIQSLKDEVRGLAKVNVPNIPRALDEGCESGFYWMAQELIEGEDLRHFIARSYHDLESCDFRFGTTSTRRSDSTPATSAEDAADTDSGQAERTTAKTEKNPDLPDIRTLVTWFRDLARALHAVHEADLLHRDIKPANIMLGPNQTPYLIDFGLSVDPADLENIVGKRAGTPAYMSPEQASLGWSGLKPATDIYSLAVTFVEVLTGKRVVNAEHRYDVMEQIQFVPVPTPHELDPKLPDSLSPIFRRATEKAVTDRYQSAGELAHDLDQWLESAGNWKPRVMFLALVALSLAALFVLVWPPRSRGQKSPPTAVHAIEASDLIDSGNPQETWIALGSHVREQNLPMGQVNEVNLFLAKSADKIITEIIAEQSIEFDISDLPPLRSKLAQASRSFLEAGYSDVSLYIVIIWDAIMNREFEEAASLLTKIPDGEVSLLTSLERRQLKAIEMLLAVKRGDHIRTAILRQELALERDNLITVLRCLAVLNDAKSGIWEESEVQEACQVDINHLMKSPEWRRVGKTIQLLLSLTTGDFEKAKNTADLLYLLYPESNFAESERLRAGVIVFSIVARLACVSQGVVDFLETEDYRTAVESSEEFLRAHPGRLYVIVDRIRNYLRSGNPRPYLSWLDTFTSSKESVSAESREACGQLLYRIMLMACCDEYTSERNAIYGRIVVLFQRLNEPRNSLLDSCRSACDATYGWELEEDWRGRGASIAVVTEHVNSLASAARARTSNGRLDDRWWGLTEMLEGYRLLSEDRPLKQLRVHDAMEEVIDAIADLESLPESRRPTGIIDDLRVLLTKLKEELE